MLNINNKSWEDISASDIEALLSGTDSENFFFEFKADNVEPAKLVKEISAFANTYGGYILIGIEDNKTVSGCKKWTEQRIHATIHDSLTPVPNFDVKEFELCDGKVVLILKIEEGTMPPYITNKGGIFERISSGSFPVKESSKLTQLYRKRETQLEKVRKKIELAPIRLDGSVPTNVCAYIDLGFSITTSEEPYLCKHFWDYDMAEINKVLKEVDEAFRISRVGHSLAITFDCLSVNSCSGDDVIRLGNGVQNFIEIMCDGSIRCRVVIVGNESDDSADIATINLIRSFQQCYKILFSDVFPDKFIYAQKYQKLTVLKQFVAKSDILEKYGGDKFRQIYHHHINKLGEPLIVEGNRIPVNDYQLIDRRLMEQIGSEYSESNILDLLFDCEYMFLGYVF